MPYLSSLADRAWYAYHCLPRDKSGEPPAARAIEREYGLSIATLSKTFSGERERHEYSTLVKMATALRTTEHWLANGGTGAPKLTGPLPPRVWRHYRDLADWDATVTAALGRSGDPPVPPEAYLAGADMPVFREAPKLTPDLVTAIAMYAWETCSAEEQIAYSTAFAASTSQGKSSRTIRQAKKLESGPPGKGGR